MSASITVLRFVFASLLAVGIVINAQADSLTVSPVVVTLDGNTRTAALTLKNDGKEARVIHTELLRWTQENGENIHTPSRDILVNPPIVTLQPGQSQIIRIGINRKLDKSQEHAYRLYISEVPPPPKPGYSGLSVALRLVLAVFVAPAKPVDKFDWQAVRNPEGKLELTLHNSGNRHQRLTSLKVNDPENGQQLAESTPAPLTLLAGQSRRYSITLPIGWQGQQLNLIAATEDGRSESRIGLGQAVR